jgi:hypothetical protein
MRLITPMAILSALVFAQPAQAQRQLKVEAMTNQNCRVVDHNATTGDDSGGIAVSDQKVYYNGDSATGEFNLSDLGNARRVTGSARYSMISNLADGKLYALWNRQGNTPVSTRTTMNGMMFDALKELDNNMNPTQNMIVLSQGINLPRSYSTTGHVLLAGFDAIGIGTYNGRWYVISMEDGQVTDVGPRGGTRAYQCETWAKWGVLEYYDDQFYALFRAYGQQNIARVNMSTGQGGTAFNFQTLSDMCSLSISPTTQKWYFHHEGRSQFGGSSETVGSCDATIVTNSPPLWTVPDPLTVYAGQMVRANVSVIEADGDEMEVSVRGLPDGAIWNQLAGKFRWEPTISDAGEHTVRFTAQEIRNDGEEPLTSEAHLVINVIALDAPPAFSSAPPAASVAQGDEFVYEMFAVDPEAAGEVTYGLIEGPNSMTVEGNVLRWTADLRPGETTAVRVYAADIEGNRGYQSFSVGVDTHPQAPVAVIVSQDAERGPGRVRLSGVPSYAMGDRVLTFDWKLAAFPEGVTPPPVESAATAMASALLRSKGTYRFELQVHDGELYSNTVGIDIAVVNVAPVAVVGEPIEFVIGEGNEVEITLDGSDSYDVNSEDSMSCTWAQTAGPDVTLEDAEALATKFTAYEAGDYEFSLSCTDGELTGEPAVLAVKGTAPAGSGDDGPSRPVTPDDGCSSMAVSTWLLFGLVAVRRRRRR